MIRSALVCLCVLGAAVSMADAGPLNPPAGPIDTTGRFGPRIELNQQNTPGDADSVFKILQPGSYYLSAELVGQPGKHGIEIVSSNVVLDLCGFRLVGGTGALTGVLCASTSSNITIKNGMLFSWNTGVAASQPINELRAVDLQIGATEAWGIDLSSAEGARIDRCYASFAGLIDTTAGGIKAGDNAQVIECAARNCPVAFDGGNGSIFDRCVSGECAEGIRAGERSLVTGCVFDGAGNTLMGSIGVFADFGTRVEGSIVRFFETGIVARDLAVVEGCSVASCSTGIVAWRQTVIRNNNVSNYASDGFGIDTIGATQFARIDSNHCTRGGTGVRVQGNLNFIVRNTTGFNSVADYDIAAANRVGPIVVDPSAPAANAWSNFIPL